MCWKYYFPGSRGECFFTLLASVFLGSWLLPPFSDKVVSFYTFLSPSHLFKRTFKVSLNLGIIQNNLPTSVLADWQP
jgi:hypothetical protein